MGAACAGQEAKLDFGQTELSCPCVTDDASRAGEGNLEPPSKAGAVYGGDDRHPEGRQTIQGLLPLARECCCFGFGVGLLQHAEVGAGEEIGVFARGEHHRLEVRDRVELVESGVELLAEGFLEGVHRFAGDVHSDDGHTVRADLGSEGRLLFHCASWVEN